MFILAGCQSSHCVVRWSIFLLTETGSRRGPVRLHLHTRPSHLDQSAVLGGHLLLWGAKPDPSALPHRPWGKTAHHCQDQGEVLKSTFFCLTNVIYFKNVKCYSFNSIIWIHVFYDVLNQIVFLIYFKCIFCLKISDNFSLHENTRLAF